MSSNKWPKVALGDVLIRTSDTIELAPEKLYKEVTIRLWGKGIKTRRIATGAEIGTGRRYRVKEGQFILSRIDARNGAMGIVPRELDGAVVTNDFPSFETNDAKLNTEFLGWLSKTKGFVESCRKVSEGTTNRVRLKEENFFGVTIPLPPLHEQKRIVARIDSLVAKINEAKDLKLKSKMESEQICRAILRDERYGKVSPIPMRELVTWRKPHVDVLPTDTYEFAGVYCFGRGVFRGARKSGTNFAYKKLTQIRSGEFMYPKLMAWEGAFGVVPPNLDGLFVSPEFPLFTIDKDKVLPAVLDIHFRSPSVWPLIGGISTGTNVRRRRLNPKDFLNYKFPLPSQRAQIAAQKIKQRFDSVKNLDCENQLTALIPSILDRAFKGEL